MNLRDIFLHINLKMLIGRWIITFLESVFNQICHRVVAVCQAAGECNVVNTAAVLKMQETAEHSHVTLNRGHETKREV
jgi:hypothetical protein